MDYIQSAQRYSQPLLNLIIFQKLIYQIKKKKNKKKNKKLLNNTRSGSLTDTSAQFSERRKSCSFCWSLFGQFLQIIFSLYTMWSFCSWILFFLFSISIRSEFDCFEGFLIFRTFVQQFLQFRVYIIANRKDKYWSYRIGHFCCQNFLLYFWLKKVFGNKISCFFLNQTSFIRSVYALLIRCLKRIWWYYCPK